MSIGKGAAAAVKVFIGEGTPVKVYIKYYMND